MHRLYLLGRIDLRDAQGTEVRTLLAQPKRLALTAYLCVGAAGGSCRRDRLLALFWPELSQESARKALNKAVHFVRQALGEDVLISRGAELGVHHGRLWCDAAAFVEAVEAGRAAKALELYNGELLPAFYVDGAPEFEEWLEGARTQLRMSAARAARLVAEEREREGSVTAAVTCARRAMDLSDGDERIVRHLLELLDRLGDRAGALQAYDSFARRLAAEYDAEPAAETKALVARIRAREATRATMAGAPPPPEARREPDRGDAATDALRARGYEVEREISRGGMATVYLALDVKHGRRVAVKVLAPQLGALRLADRFATEIRVTAKLQHPNILPLFDSGEVDGLLYYVTPYVEGESLRTRLERHGWLPIDEAVALVRTLASALDYAHGQGVVHRDIKPENILLQAGQPLLSDFGIALALSSAGGERITAMGLSLGTPQYMSPEQAAGQSAMGRASDIYSLGAVAYELLTGAPPFTGPDVQAVLARVLLESPRPLRAVRGTVPEGVERAVLEALAKRPDDRFPTAGAFAAALQQGMTGAKGIGRRARAWARFGPVPRAVVSAGATAALLVAVSAWAIARFGGSSRANGASMSRVAVFPFSVQASSELSYLGEGLMDLLGVTIDGTGELRRADPFAVMTRVRRSATGATPDLEAAQEIAADLRAGRYVMGRVADIAGRVTVSASLYELRRPGSPIREATAMGSRDSLPGLLTGMVRDLLKGIPLGSGLPDIATIVTDNPEALKAYLQGEAFIRRGWYDSAAVKLCLAARLDTAFALAWHQLSIPRGWGAECSDRVDPGERALRHADRLPERERRFLEAERTFYSGDWRRATVVASDLTRRYPDDARAWFRLALTRAVFNWAQGRSPAEAREPLQRALALERPLPELVNLAINVAVIDRRTDGLRRLLPRAIHDANGRGLAESARAFAAFADGDPGARDTLRRLLDEGDQDSWAWIGNVLLKGTDSLEAAEDVWRRYRDRSRRSVGGVYLAATQLARGRWRDGRDEFGRVNESILGAAVPAWYAGLPFFDRPKGELRQLRDSMKALVLPEGQLGIGAIGLFIRPALNPWAREYIVGLLSARLGDRRDALRRAEGLEAATVPPDSSDIRQDLALEIRALLALEAGDNRTALRLLEQQSMKLGHWWDVSTMFHRRLFGRFLRAELLARAGRDREALDWFGTFAGPFWGYEFVLFAPAYLRIGQLHERSGNPREAIEYYERFVTRWSNADPEYQPLVREARARLARLRK